MEGYLNLYVEISVKRGVDYELRYNSTSKIFIQTQA